MLWLALHFPLLTLEALPLRQSPEDGAALAVAARGRILVADLVATAAGVLPGQKLSTALGLSPGLRVCERDPARETRALVDLGLQGCREPAAGEGGVCGSGVGPMDIGAEDEEFMDGGAMNHRSDEVHGVSVQ